MAIGVESPGLAGPHRGGRHRHRHAPRGWELFERRILLDAGPTLSAQGFQATRPVTGSSAASFEVLLNPPSLETAVTVHYQIVPGSAVPGVDYNAAASGDLTFFPDDTEQAVDLTVLGSTQARGPRTLSLVLSNPVGAVLDPGGATAVGRIDDAVRAGTLQFASATDTFVDATGTPGLATVTVTRAGGTASDVTVRYATGGGTAIPGVDYTPTSGTLVFGFGQTAATFTVPVLPNLLTNRDATIGLALSDPGGGGALGTPSAATLTIRRPNPLVVTNTSDAGLGSLRQAILASDAIPGTDEILFDIPGAGPFTIAPGSTLPAITDPTVVDARTEPGYAGTPLVRLDGSDISGLADGLDVLAGQSAIYGLSIGGFGGSGVVLASDGNTVQQDRIGTDPAGSAAAGNGEDGVYVIEGSSNTIGGPTLGQGNLVSGNGNVGVDVTGPGASGNVILGNLIGTDATGLRAIGNARGGVFLNGAAATAVGGTGPADRNLISGNGASGVVASNGSTGSLIRGNLIGVDVTGLEPLSNGGDGVYLEAAPGNMIGGDTAGAGNVISANGLVGVRLSGAGSSGNAVLGNRIGTDAAGALRLGNRYDGVFVVGAPRNLIGDGTAAGLNVVSANGSSGVQLYQAGASGNAVLGNRIGTDASGLRPLGNARDGVFLDQAPGNVVGSGNVISANGQAGVQLLGSGATGNVVMGNRIGTDANGRPTLGNVYGLLITQATGNVVQPNTIAGNAPTNTYTDAGQPGPFVRSTTAQQTGGLLTAVVLDFSGPMDPTRARDLRNYALRPLSARGKPGSPVPLASATYDPATASVTLTLAAPASGSISYQVTALAGPTLGLTSQAGVFLDGDDNGRPGGTYVAAVGR